MLEVFGMFVLEMSGMLSIIHEPLTEVLVPLFYAVLVGLGDEPDDALASIASARKRAGV